MRHVGSAQDRRDRDRLTAPLRAGLLAALALVVLPIPVMAADPSAGAPGVEQPTADQPTADQPAADQPSTDASDPTPSPDPTPTPPPDPTPTPPPDPTPGPEPTPSPGPTPQGIVAKLIYRSPAIVRQYTNYWCVPAAVQSMWNLVAGTSNIRYSRQRTLYSHIRQHNRYHYRTNGNDVQGWAWAMRYYARQPYWARSYTSRTVALSAIVDALDRTGHPVGVVVRHGTHAWIVLGYKARPLASDPSQRTILGFYVSGPLGPGSRDPWKYGYMSMAAFNKLYTRYHEATRRVIWEGRYVIVSE